MSYLNEPLTVLKGFGENCLCNPTTSVGVAVELDK